MISAAHSPGGPYDVEELVLLAGVFPAFHLWRDVACGGTRFVAQGRSLATRPHTLVCRDLAELRAALSVSQPRPA